MALWKTKLSAKTKSEWKNLTQTMLKKTATREFKISTLNLISVRENETMTELKISENKWKIATRINYAVQQGVYFITAEFSAGKFIGQSNGKCFFANL